MSSEPSPCSNGLPRYASVTAPDCVATRAAHIVTYTPATVVHLPLTRAAVEAFWQATCVHLL
eukprot:2996301-Pleurochrysis_carterae.AAC.1